MITESKVARNVSDLMIEFSAKLNSSVVDVREACPEDEFANYRHAVARVMDEMLLGIMNPIYDTHPALKPAGLE